jgi:hypothetical protein
MTDLPNEPVLADRANTGKPQLSYVLSAPYALLELTARFEAGAKKYSRNNWKKGLKVSELVNSMMRHLLEYSNGVDQDAEDESLTNVSGILWNAFILAEMAGTRPDMDDRVK